MNTIDVKKNNLIRVVSTGKKKAEIIIGFPVQGGIEYQTRHLLLTPKGWRDNYKNLYVNLD